MGLRSLRGVTIHLDALERKGFIKRSSKARGIRIVREVPSGKPQGFIKIPILGEIHAGTPLLAEGNIERYVNVRKGYLKGTQKASLLRVKGDSMVDEGIYEDDLAIISSQARAENGDIVVALLEDEVVLKKLHRVGDYIALLPGNPKYAPIIGKEFSIQGKLIGVIRRGGKRE